MVLQNLEFSEWTICESDPGDVSGEARQWGWILALRKLIIKNSIVCSLHNTEQEKKQEKKLRKNVTIKYFSISDSVTF